MRRGAITKTGNNYARRALVEGAWAYRMKPRVGRHKVDRIEALPKAVRDIGWTGPSASLRSLPPTERVGQERQSGRGRHRARNGWLHLVDRLSRPNAKGGVTENTGEAANRGDECSEVAMTDAHRWRRDNAGEPSSPL